MNSFTFRTPMFIETGVRKKKNIAININQTRNMMFHTLNNLKKKFKEIVSKEFPKKTFYKAYRLEYEIFLPNKMKRDIMNIGSMVDKFSNDALVEQGICEEDNYTCLQDVRFTYGGYDPDKKGYIIVTVIEVDKKDLKD